MVGLQNVPRVFINGSSLSCRVIPTEVVHGLAMDLLLAFRRKKNHFKDKVESRISNL